MQAAPVERVVPLWQWAALAREPVIQSVVLSGWMKKAEPPDVFEGWPGTERSRRKQTFNVPFDRAPLFRCHLTVRHEKLHQQAWRARSSCFDRLQDCGRECHVRREAEYP